MLCDSLNSGEFTQCILCAVPMTSSTGGIIPEVCKRPAPTSMIFDCPVINPVTGSAQDENQSSQDISQHQDSQVDENSSCNHMEIRNQPGSAHGGLTRTATMGEWPNNELQVQEERRMRSQQVEGQIAEVCRLQLQEVKEQLKEEECFGVCLNSALWWLDRKSVV